MSKNNSVPVWFYESFYFCHPSAVLEVGKLTLQDLKDEWERIRHCKTVEDYLRMSRTGATFRMDRREKKAFWDVLRNGYRW